MAAGPASDVVALGVAGLTPAVAGLAPGPVAAGVVAVRLILTVQPSAKLAPAARKDNRRAGSVIGTTVLVAGASQGCAAVHSLDARQGQHAISSSGGGDNLGGFGCSSNRAAVPWVLTTGVFKTRQAQQTD